MQWNALHGLVGTFRRLDKETLMHVCQIVWLIGMVATVAGMVAAAAVLSTDACHLRHRIRDT